LAFATFFEVCPTSNYFHPSPWRMVIAGGAHGWGDGGVHVAARGDGGIVSAAVRVGLG
jgi:hypothetical protein